jgi:hypothetical protein
VTIKATRQRTLKHTRQGNQVMTLHLRAPKYHCRQCGRYFCHRFTGVRPRFRSSEAFRLEVFEARGHHSAQDHAHPRDQRGDGRALVSEPVLAPTL